MRRSWLMILDAVAAGWNWIGANHEPQTVLVAALGAGAAIVYALLTRRLWRETQSLAAETRALATESAAQTRLTRDIFQAEQRPYVGVRVDFLAYLDQHDLRTSGRCRVYLRNHGKTPAIVATLLVEATYMERPLGELDLGAPALYLFPGEEQPVHLSLALGGNPGERRHGDHPLIVKARIDYTGTPGAPTMVHNTAAIFHVTRTDGTFVAHQVTT
jgi:hypothetical protein